MDGDALDAEGRKSVETFSGGANQARMAAWNERLILSLIHRNTSLPKSEIARRTGLSAQTVSTIARRMEEEGLILKGNPIRGRVGQPSVPLSLNPEGVFSFGLKIGRRSADLMLMDFTGGTRGLVTESYAWPDPHAILAFTRRAFDALVGGVRERGRIAGIGVALPFELWNWAEEVGTTPETMQVWRDFDLAAALERELDIPVHVANDGTAACGAELTFGIGGAFADFVYVFIGTFVGGGIVLNHAVYPGRTGNAGALGSMQVEGGQLIGRASIFVLENRLRARGIAPRALWEAEDWSRFDPDYSEWVEEVAQALAHAILSASSVIDFEGAVIDGGFPAAVRARVVERTREAMARLDSQGVALPDLREGTIGSLSRAMGGASLPLFSRYFLDQNAMFTAAG